RRGRGGGNGLRWALSCLLWLLRWPDKSAELARLGPCFLKALQGGRLWSGSEVRVMESHARGIDSDQHRGMEDIQSPVFEGARFQKDNGRLVVGQCFFQLEAIG